jgi:hypothetical protein
MVWNNGWINYSGQKSVQSAPPLHCVPLAPAVPSASLPQVWEPETVTREQATRAALTAQVAQAHGSRVALNAHGEVVVAAVEDEHEKNLADLIKRKGHPETQEQLHTAALEAGYTNEQSTALYSLYRAKFKPLPSLPAAVDGMTFQPTTQAKKKQDEAGMTFRPGTTMGTKKPAADTEARAAVARDIEASLAQVRALSAGTSPAAAVRTPVRPQRSGLDMVAAARLFMKWMQAQSDTAARSEIAAARQEVAALAQRIEADRAAKRMTGRA